MRSPVQILLSLLLVVTTAGARGGQGPETTLLVVNADSPLSLTVANHWMALRPIPHNHVVWLHDIPTLETISMEQFRERILGPIMDFIEQEGLENAIDTITYSADFPYAVDLRKELKRAGLPRNRYIGIAGSITGLTYFANQVMAEGKNYIGGLANEYFRRTLGPRAKPSAEFSRTAAGRYDKALKALKEKRPQQALELLKPLLEEHPAVHRLHVALAEVLAVLGNTETALDHLEKAHWLGWNNSLELRNKRHLASLHDHPRFRNLVRAMDQPSDRFEPPQGFSSRYHWQREGMPGADDSDRYYLSTLLAYTGQRGNSLPEIRAYLERAASSDGTFPSGTVYLMENRDVRTETRQPWFAETCELLKKIGRRCRILRKGQEGEDGNLPKKRKDIIGLVAGIRTFDWKKSGSRMLPGAIAESLTSYAGDFDNASQTKLTEFLRHGAAGSSGAVVEPYAFPEKFPSPLMHYYYALGYTLAESWYMSVAAPYQTLLVGDPLTSPFRDPLRFRLESPLLDEPWQGKVQFLLRPEANDEVDHFEIWIDGSLFARTAPGEPFELDTRALADGSHELHLVAVEGLPRDARTTHHYRFRVDNHGLHPELGALRPKVPFGMSLLLHGTAPEGSHLSLRQGSRELYSLSVPGNGQWHASLDSTRLGMGQITIHARIRTDKGLEANSDPLTLTITEPLIRQPASPGSPKEHFELLLETSDRESNLEQGRLSLDLLDGKYSRQIKRRSQVVSATISGTFHVERSGFHQLAIRTHGPLSIEVDGRKFALKAPQAEYGLVFLPLFLEKGAHQIRIQPSPQGMKWLQVTLAGQDPPRILGSKRQKKRKDEQSRRKKMKQPARPHR